jgi:hypothetical protein
MRSSASARACGRTVAALLVRPLAFEAFCGTKISGDVELHRGLKQFNVIGSKTGTGLKFSWGNRTVQTHCLNKRTDDLQGLLRPRLVDRERGFVMTTEHCSDHSPGRSLPTR